VHRLGAREPGGPRPLLVGRSSSRRPLAIDLDTRKVAVSDILTSSGCPSRSFYSAAGELIEASGSGICYHAPGGRPLPGGRTAITFCPRNPNAHVTLRAMLLVYKGALYAPGRDFLRVDPVARTYESLSNGPIARPYGSLQYFGVSARYGLIAWGPRDFDNNKGALYRVILPGE
ncbi:hypothetical protein HQ560_19860, partial [bacterium]|nr:hypothetical protein [bacterium]